MKRLTLTTILALLLASVPTSWSAIPETMSYQGVLRLSPSELAPDGNYNITFRLYNLATGGTTLWEEGQLVAVANGRFNVILGSVQPLNLPFDEQYYLGVQVGLDPEMSPRIQLAASPYSHNADIQDGAITLDKLAQNGATDDQVIKWYDGAWTPRPDETGGGAVPDGDWSFSPGKVWVEGKNVGIGTDMPAEELEVAGSIRASGDFDAQGDITVMGRIHVGDESPPGANNLIVEGRAGIGTTSLTQKLHVVENGTLDAGRFQSNNTSNSNLHAITAEWAGATALGSAIFAEYTGSGTYDAAAVRGECVPVDYYGIGGSFKGGYVGVWGEVMPTGSSSYYGVNGAVHGGSGSNYAIYGSASSGATNWAGYFNGDVRVTGTLDNTLALTRIDHPLDPENKMLVHASVASSEMKTVYDGIVYLDAKGEAWVRLEDWLEAYNGDFRYQLTPIGSSAPGLYVAEEVSGNQFKIAGGEPGMKVSWQVTGVRKDAFSQANRFEVEEIKRPEERGLYIHPTAFGLSENSGIDRTRERSELQK